MSLAWTSSPNLRRPGRKKPSSTLSEGHFHGLADFRMVVVVGNAQGQGEDDPGMFGHPAARPPARPCARHRPKASKLPAGAGLLPRPAGSNPTFCENCRYLSSDRPGLPPANPREQRCRKEPRPSRWLSTSRSSGFWHGHGEPGDAAEVGRHSPTPSPCGAECGSRAVPCGVPLPYPGDGRA